MREKQMKKAKEEGRSEEGGTCSKEEGGAEAAANDRK
jgi:hypothetical protein